MVAEDLVEYNARPNFRDPASAHGVLFKKDLCKAVSHADSTGAAERVSHSNQELTSPT